MQGCDWFNGFISGVWRDLGERDDYNQAYLSGWFLDPANLGNLNILIDTCYKTTGYYNDSGVATGVCITPKMCGPEQGIFKALFDVFFYGREAKKSLQSSYGGEGSWTSLREGDSSITQINRSELARTFNLLEKDSRANLNNLVDLYLRNVNSPLQVAGDDTVPGGYYYGGSRDIYNWRERYY